MAFSTVTGTRIGAVHDGLDRRRLVGSVASSLVGHALSVLALVTAGVCAEGVLRGRRDGGVDAEHAETDHGHRDEALRSRGAACAARPRPPGGEGEVEPPVRLATAFRRAMSAA